MNRKSPPYAQDIDLAQANHSHPGQNTLSKLFDHTVEDDKLVELIGNSNKLLKSIMDKYSQKNEKLIGDEIQREISALVFNKNSNKDKAQMQTFINKIESLIERVAVQKDELAAYRNELKEVIQLTPSTDSNNQRLIDIEGIIQYLDLKIFKIENNLASARNQITLLNKCFDVTFFHLKEAIERKTPDNLYLHVISKLSHIKNQNNKAKFSLVVPGALLIISGIYHSVASQIEWKSKITSYETYHLLNIGWEWGVFHATIGAMLIAIGLIKRNNVNMISEKQNQIYKLCKK